MNGEGNREVASVTSVRRLDRTARMLPLCEEETSSSGSVNVVGFLFYITTPSVASFRLNELTGP